MISRIIGLEQNRLKQMGYDSIITPISLTVSKNIINLPLGNDAYILTGIRISDNDVVADTHRICIASATDGLTATQREISVMGQATYKTMRRFLIIKTQNQNTSDTSAFSTEQDVPTYTLDFIKITPTKKA